MKTVSVSILAAPRCEGKRGKFLPGSFAKTLAALCCSSIGMGLGADITVNTADDQFDSPTGAEISLREAVRDAQAGDVILFDAVVFSDPANVITLGSEIEVDKSISIQASALENGVVVSGGGATRLFSVTETGNLSLDNLTLREGNGAGAVENGFGGALYNDGTLVIDSCTLEDNTATSGGAIYNKGSLTRTLMVNDSTLTGNTASTGLGGGIFNDGTLTLTQCTVTGNSAANAGAAGGAVYNLKTLTIVQSTIVGNYAEIGGGIGVFDASRTSVGNSIIAGNLTGVAGSPTDIGFAGDPLPAFNLLFVDPNIIGTNDSISDVLPEGGLVGTNILPLDPQLYELGNYGGPTETMPPRPGGPGIDAGSPSVLFDDQRGFERTLGGGVDLGSVEASAGDFGPDGLTLYAEVPNAAAAPGETVTFEISTDPEFLPTVTTYAGVADVGGLEDGSRNTSKFNLLTGVAQDAFGNFFIADTGNHRIRMISPSGEVTTIAGSGEGLFGYGFLDGPGSIAKFAFPSALAVGPDGNVIVADTFNQRIRKLTRPGVGGDPWVVTTLAGNGIAGFRDGSGAAAQFNQPKGVVVDGDGNVFVADSENHRIRKITPDGASVSTHAGTGSTWVSQTLAGCVVILDSDVVTCSSTADLRVGHQVSGPGIPAGSEIISVIDETNFRLDVEATGSDPAADLVVRAEGPRTSANFNTPFGLVFNESGSILFVADRDNHRICQITLDQPGAPVILGEVSPFAGTGTAGFVDDPVLGPVGSARFHSPVAIAVDQDDNLYIADEFNHAIRKISPAGLVSTVAGLGFDQRGETDGRSDVASFDCPTGLVVDRVNIEGTVVVTDTQNHLLRRVSEKSLEVEAVIGAENPLTGRTHVHAQLNIEELGLNPDTTYYTRWVTTAPIIPNTQKGGQSFYLFAPPTIATLDYADLVPVTALLRANVDPNGSTTVVSFEYADNPQMTGAQSVVIVPGVYELAGDPEFEVSTLIPQPSTAGETVYLRAVATNARGTVKGEIISFTFPVTEVVTLDATGQTRTSALLNGSVNAMGSSTAVKFEYSTNSDLSAPWQVSTVAGSGEAGMLDALLSLEAMFHSAPGVAVVDGNAYVADRENHLIRKVAANGEVTTFAGSVAGFADGIGAAAMFDHPAGIASDGSGNLIVADERNHRVRRIEISTGEVTTVAGSSTAGYLDDFGTAAQFLFPKGVSVGVGGDIYVADSGNHVIRRIAEADDLVTTIAGDGTEGLIDGAGNLARFSLPQGLTVDDAGSVFVADTGNHTIRKISAAGIVTTVAGTGTSGFLDGPGEGANFASPVGIVSLDGQLIVADRDNHRIRLISSDGQTSTLAGSDEAGRVDSPVGMLHPPSAATFELPSGIALDSDGALWVTDEGNHDLRKIARIDLPFVEVPAPLTGSSAEAVDASVNGLLAGATYYFRAVGTNSVGPIEGEILSFTTLTNQAIELFDGLATSDPQLQSDQSAVVNFGITPGGTPVPRSLTILNSGQWDLSVTSVVVPDGFSVSLASEVISPGETVTFEVVLEATAGASPAGNLVIHSDDPALGAFSLPIAGVVLAAPTVSTLEAETEGGVVLRGLVHPELSTTTVGFQYSTHPELNGFSVSTLAGLSTGFANGAGDDARFNSPSGVAVDSAGNVYVADTLNHCIRKISPDGTATIFAGESRIPGFNDGTPELAQFNEPVGIAINSEGTLFVCDSKNHRIRSITTGGEVSTYAGFGDPGFTDGVGSAARFNQPAGIAVDSSGIVYVADTLNHRVRKIALDKTVSTLVGSEAGGDLNQPNGIAVASSGVVYLTQVGSHQILRVGTDGSVSPFAGGSEGYLDAVGTSAQFGNPVGLAINAEGHLVVADSGNHRIRVVNLSSGLVGTLAGSGEVITRDGDDEASAFAHPIAITSSASGVMIVGESTNSVIRKVVSSTVSVVLDESLSEGLGETLVTTSVEGLLEDEKYYFRVFAQNGGGLSQGDIRGIGELPLVGFPAWQALHFPDDLGEDSISGPDADPEGDGIKNLLEYAFFLNPNVPSSGNVPIIVVSPTSITLEYPRLPAASDLVYTAEWSTDLVNWRTDGITESVISSTADVEQIAASISRGSIQKIFFRVRVTLQ